MNVWEVSGAQGKGSAAFPHPGVSMEKEKGDPSTPRSIVVLRLGALPTPHVFPLKSWMGNNTEPFQKGQAGSALPGGDRTEE